MKYTITLLTLMIMALGCQSQTKKKAASKPKADGHDSTYYVNDVDTTHGYIQYRGVNGEEMVSKGFKVHYQVWKMTVWVPNDTAKRSLGIGGWGDSFDSGTDHYFITVDGHTGEIPSEQVIIFLKTRK